MRCHREKGEPGCQSARSPGATPGGLQPTVLLIAGLETEDGPAAERWGRRMTAIFRQDEFAFTVNAEAAHLGGAA